MNQSISSSDCSDSEDATFVVNKEHERILKNSNIFKEYEQNNNNCIRHPNKKAKFYVHKDHKQLFCSKCALNLALQGLKIEESQELQFVQERRDKIQQFSEHLNLALRNCDQKMTDLNGIIENLKIKMEEQQQNCFKFFDEVKNTALQLQQTYLSKFSNDFVEFKGQVQDNFGTVKSLTLQLKQFQEDIEINHDNIVKTMEMKPFQEIMSKYEKKVEDTMAKLAKCDIRFSPKKILFEKSQILPFMNKMCYNLLLKNDAQEYYKPEEEDKVINFNQQLQLQEQQIFEQLQMEEFYQNTFSNPLKQSQIQSPLKSNAFGCDHMHSHPINSQQNTPENLQQKHCIQKINFSVTPNEKDIPQQYSSRVGEVSAKKVLHKQLNDKFGYQYYEKQKTTTECERGSENSNSYWNNNISCLHLQKFIKDVERGSLEIRELSPKQQILAQGAISKQKKSIKHFTQKSQQFLSNHQILKQQFDSVPNLKVLASHENQLRLQQQRYLEINKRSKSKQPKQQSQEQSEGRRHFILSGQSTSYPSQLGQNQTEDTLKDKILKELCSHPGESVYSQVLKCSQKQKNAKVSVKENCEWSTTRNKSNGYSTNKKS